MSKRVVIITAQNFQDEEVIYPFYRLQEIEGCIVDLATPGGQTLTGKYGVPARANVSAENLNADDYDMVVIPGGFEAPDRLRIIKEVTEFVAQMDAKGKIISSICHGPWVMISAKIVKGRTLTSYIAVKDDLENAGAIYVSDQAVVVDRNFITSAHYRDNGPWMRETIKVLLSK
ncbi:MAG: type 1 glutamine amidotransferase [Campylobacteraceae bacterium]|nr:type 1 glutamine amidotransferase [Campylobacteraceae bacterium]